MTSDGLTSDNFPLSSLNFETGAAHPRPDGGTCAINCTTLLNRIEAFARASRSTNTHLAYKGDLAAFQAWGGTLPATPLMVAAYLAEHADTLSVATLKRRLAAISSAHQSHQLSNPVTAGLVRATLRGIARTRGRPAQAATPLLRDDLFKVLDRFANASAKNSRDRALLLTGFAGWFRRSELIGLDVADLEFASQGVIATVRHSKTDQRSAGQQVAIPYGSTTHCPVQALQCWLQMLATDTGALFRPINRHGAISNERLSAAAVSNIIKKRLAAADINPIGYSAHSLRSGFATSAAIAGTPLWKIRMQTRHATNKGVARYIRPNGMFKQNAAADVL
ncbi:site-specific integrase [Hyphomicrobium sp. DY-1]|uniref:site-specific integrase n=1 Tax=Hyphomicrobium sp. DY-1 TaxID=3075650 RepID=UPI0039C3CE8D